MAKARERPRLVEEALAAPGEVVGEAGAARHHFAAAAHGELDRQVFLDRHDLGELAVEGAVGDAEAAMADHRIQPVVAELGAKRQGLDVVDTHVGARMRPLYHRALLIVVVCRRVAASWICGTSWISMMSTQRPMAVIMVAGRVCKCGLGSRFWRWSDMADISPNDFFKKTCRDPKYEVRPADTI